MQNQRKTIMPSRHMFKNKQYAFGNRFVLGMLLSILCILIDNNAKQINLKQSFIYIAAPLYYVANAPYNMVNYIGTWFSNKEDIIHENNILNKENIALRSKLQIAQYKNQAVLDKKKLISKAREKNIEPIYAKILAIEPTDLRQITILNKGSRDGIKRGQIAVDANGLLGQIINVGKYTSILLLISDIKSAVPIKDSRTGEYAILEGQGRNKPLLLVNLPSTAIIAQGDLIVTSGLGGIYPEGYPIGHISKISHKVGDEFMSVYVNPIAKFNRNRVVLVICEKPTQQFFLSQIKERLKVLQEQF